MQPARAERARGRRRKLGPAAALAKPLVRAAELQEQTFACPTNWAQQAIACAAARAFVCAWLVVSLFLSAGGGRPKVLGAPTKEEERESGRTLEPDPRISSPALFCLPAARRPIDWFPRGPNLESAFASVVRTFAAPARGPQASGGGASCPPASRSLCAGAAPGRSPEGELRRRRRPRLAPCRRQVGARFPLVAPMRRPGASCVVVVVVVGLQQRSAALESVRARCVRRALGRTRKMAEIAPPAGRIIAGPRASVVQARRTAEWRAREHGWHVMDNVCTIVVVFARALPPSSLSLSPASRAEEEERRQD